MKRSEFLAQLKSALENELDAREVKANLDYYGEYIQSEMEKGLSEEEVLEQLGDPWAIAKTIRLSSKMDNREYSYGSETTGEQHVTKMEYSSSLSKWKMIVTIVIILLVLITVLAAAFGILALVIQLAFRFAVPILIIIFVIKLFSKK